MKKVILGLIVASTFLACNSGETKVETEVKSDTTTVVVDSTKTVELEAK